MLVSSWTSVMSAVFNSPRLSGTMTHDGKQSTAGAAVTRGHRRLPSPDPVGGSAVGIVTMSAFSTRRHSTKGEQACNPGAARGGDPDGRHAGPADDSALGCQGAAAVRHLLALGSLHFSFGAAGGAGAAS